MFIASINIYIWWNWGWFEIVLPIFFYMKTVWLLQKVRKPHLYATFFSSSHSVICGYTTGNHVYGQTTGDQTSVIFAKKLLKYWPTVVGDTTQNPRTVDQSSADLALMHDQRLQTLGGCHKVLWKRLRSAANQMLMQSYARLPTGCKDFVTFWSNSSNDSTGVAKWPR